MDALKDVLKPNLPVVVPGRLVTQGASGVRSVAFGADSFGLNTPDNKLEDPNRVLAYQDPKPRRWFQKVVQLVNNKIMLKGLVVQVSPADIKRLRSLPQGAGNLLVGPHQDMPDGGITSKLYELARQVPAGRFIASEEMEKRWFLKPFFRWAGCVPIRRGHSNKEATEYMVKQLAKGGWGDLFPEGSVYWSREVMPMEWGAFKMAFEAASKAQKAGQKKPMFITPFVHIYKHNNPDEMQRNMDKALAELETRPDLGGQLGTGTWQERIVAVGEKILQHKMAVYNVPQDQAPQGDFFERAQWLKTYLLEDLEKRHLGGVKSGTERRRANKVRMIALEALTKPHTPDQEAALRRDAQQAKEIARLIPVNKPYFEKMHDLETIAEYLRRFRDQMAMTSEPFSKRTVYLKVLPPKNISEKLAEFQALPTEVERNQYLSDQTEALRQEIQHELYELVKEHP
jgi:1-acyl-sn-glycerol-3-phosphate acyltransferase